MLAVLFAVVTSRPNEALSEQADGLDANTTLADATGVSADAVAAAPSTADPTTTSTPTTAAESTTTAPPTTAPAPAAASAPNPGPWPGPGQVALTFDDGPDPTWTEQILDVLDQ